MNCFLQEDNSRVDLFVQHSKKSGGSSLSCFLPLLLRPDAFIAHQAARILATICVTSVDQIQEQELDYYFNWFITQLNTTGVNIIDSSQKQDDIEYLKDFLKTQN